MTTMKPNHNNHLSTSLPNLTSYNISNITNTNTNSTTSSLLSSSTLFNNINALSNSNSNSSSGSNIGSKQLFDFDSNKENNINQLNITPTYNTKVKIITNNNNNNHYISNSYNHIQSISPNNSYSLLPPFNPTTTTTTFIPIINSVAEKHSIKSNYQSQLSPTGTPTQLGSPISPYDVNNPIFNPFNTNNNNQNNNQNNEPDSSDLDHQKPSKKFRNSQTLFYNNFHRLSLASDKNSPLSRSTSDLSHALVDINDSDEICTLTRSQTYCLENMNTFNQKPNQQQIIINNQNQNQNQQQLLNQLHQQLHQHLPPQVPRDSPSRLNRKIDFGHQTGSLNPSPISSSILLPLSSSAPSYLTPLTLSTSPSSSNLSVNSGGGSFSEITRPNTPIQQQQQQYSIRVSNSNSDSNISYPPSPPPTPIQSNSNSTSRNNSTISINTINGNGDIEIAPTPVKDTSSTMNCNISMGDENDNTSPNTSIDASCSPYKTPSKSTFSNNSSIGTTSNSFSKSPINNHIFKPFLSHIQSEALAQNKNDNVKKRSRTCLDLSLLADKDYDISEGQEVSVQQQQPTQQQPIQQQPNNQAQQQQLLTNIITIMNKQKYENNINNNNNIINNNNNNNNRHFTMPPLRIVTNLNNNNISPDSSINSGSLTSRPLPFVLDNCLPIPITTGIGNGQHHYNGHHSTGSINTNPIIQQQQMDTNNNNNNNNNNNHHFNINEHELKLKTCNGRPGFNNITPEVLSELMDQPNRIITIVDCRYGYEFIGGHINNAINIPPYQSYHTLKDRFFEIPSNREDTIVFHCEFSSKRAPEAYNLFRWLDREHNHYPNIHYPEIYLLTGGYKNFWETFPEKCTGTYVTMNDPRFSNEKKVEEDKKKQESKRSRLKSRSHSFHV